MKEIRTPTKTITLQEEADEKLSHLTGVRYSNAIRELVGYYSWRKTKWQKLAINIISQLIRSKSDWDSLTTAERIKMAEIVNEWREKWQEEEQEPKTFRYEQELEIKNLNAN